MYTGGGGAPGGGGEGGAAAGGRSYLLIKPSRQEWWEKFEGQNNFVEWAWREKKGIRRVEGQRLVLRLRLC